jgi:hypothetical protein
VRAEALERLARKGLGEQVSGHDVRADPAEVEDTLSVEVARVLVRDVNVLRPVVKLAASDRGDSALVVRPGSNGREGVAELTEEGPDPDDLRGTLGESNVL